MEKEDRLDHFEFLSNIGECLHKTGNNFIYIQHFINNQISCNRKLYEDIVEIRKNFDLLKFSIQVQQEMIDRLQKKLEDYEKRR